MKDITLNQYVLFIALMGIFIIAFFVPSFSNFNDTDKNNRAVIAWITNAGKRQALRPSQHDGKYLQIRLLVEDNGVF